MYNMQQNKMILMFFKQGSLSLRLALSCLFVFFHFKTAGFAGISALPPPRSPRRRESHRQAPQDGYSRLPERRSHTVSSYFFPVVHTNLPQFRLYI